MMMRAIATLVAPTQSITFGAVPNSVVLENRDFAAVAIAARTELSRELDDEQMNWALSESLDGPYSYLSASTSRTRSSFTRELKFAEPVIEVVIALVPWNARSKSWSASLHWDAVHFSALNLSDGPVLTLTGLAQLETYE